MASPIKQEETHPSPSTTTIASVKGEPQDLANGSPETEPIGDSAQLSKSVNDLNDLAKAIQAFKNRYDELQNHLNFIEQAIDARQKELSSPPSATPTPKNDVVQSNSETAKPEKEQERGMKKEKENDNESDIVSLCKTMCSRGLRKYIVSNLSNPNLLRKQVPEALKSAPKPSKIVLECIGRFFLQGSKAYTKDSPMIASRNASVLVLELYLLSGCVGSEKSVEASLKEEASSAAVAWRKRLIVEGGLAKASEADARGLLLFVACFGVPGVFKNEDVCNLVRLSNPGEISQALRKSQGMIRKASDIADEMLRKGSVVEGLDLAYTFGFEEKFSPATLLTSFLQKSEDAWKKSKQDSRDTVLKEADEKYLAALKSVVNCLQGHKIDFTKLLPGWPLKDKIVNLEKSIGDVKKKIEEKSVITKRKVDKSSSSNKVKIPETKRSRFTVRDPPMPSPSVMALQDQRMTSHMNVNSSYDGALPAHLLEGSRSYGYSSYYPSASSVQIGSASGSLPESYLGGTIASGINLHGGAAAGSYSYSGYQGDRIVDNGGSMLNSNSNSYRWHEIDGGVLSATDRSIGQSFVGQPTSARVSSLYGKTSVDGFAGLPDHPSIGVSSRRGGSDLYSFADSVFDA